jgi:hypothetical protein
MWCNKFREFFGDYIDKYAKQYNIPKQLLAGIIANEMIDWKFPDGTWFDGIKGGGIGYAQITLDTAREYGFSGSNTELKQLLNSYEGSVAAALKILKNYLDSFQQDIENNNLGKGFSESVLYYMANPAILKSDDLTRLNVPEWLLNSMSAAWNSGVKVFHAKDKIGKNNYRNAFIHGENSSLLFNYLAKLVNE